MKALTKTELEAQLGAIRDAELAAEELQRICNIRAVEISTAQDRLDRALKLQTACELHLEATRAELDLHRTPTNAFIDSTVSQEMVRPFVMERLIDVFDRIKVGAWTVSEIQSRHIEPLREALSTAVAERDSFAKSNPGIEPFFE